MLLVLTNICRGCDITSVTRCGADLETITSTLMFSDQPNSGLRRIVYPSLLTIFRKQDVWKTRGDLRQQGGLPDWPGPWRGDQDLSCCLYLQTYFQLPWSGPGLVLVVPQPRRLPAPAPRRRERGGEAGENIKHSQGIIPIFWSQDEYLLIPNFPFPSSHPDSLQYYNAQYIFTPFIVKLHRHVFIRKPEGKDTTLQTCFILTCFTFSFFFLSLFTFQFV